MRIVFFVVLCLLPQAAFCAELPFTISRETTYFTEPLKKDGTVDYLAALNKQLSEGVTKENNAAIDMLRALGPSILPENIREQTLAALETTLAADGPYFVKADTISEELSKESFITHPWKEYEHPKVAEWLQQNNAALDKLVEASNKPNYHLPLVLSDPEDPLINVLLPTLGIIKSSSIALLDRAYLCMGEGEYQQAWNDILAVHRLGDLMCQRQIMNIEKLVGIALIAMASEATCTLANTGELSVLQIKKILRDMKRLEPISDKFVERFMVLDSICWLATNPRQAFKETFKEIGNPDIGAAIEKGEVDFDPALIHYNQFCDKLNQSMAMSNYIESIKATKEILSETMETLESSRNEYMSFRLEQQKKAVGFMAIYILLPSVERVREISEKGKTNRDMACLAVAMAGYKNSMNKYPEQLSQLAPRYLPKIPKDGFSGKDLIYNPSETGYLIYSVGPNITDDGGKTKKEGGDDIVVKK